MGVADRVTCGVIRECVRDRTNVYDCLSIVRDCFSGYLRVHSRVLSEDYVVFVPWDLPNKTVLIDNPN